MKNFFEEKKRSLKFKLAGPGHKLTESSENATSSSKPEPPQKRVDNKESQEQRSAVLAAALQRSLGNTNVKKTAGGKKQTQKPGPASDVELGAEQKQPQKPEPALEAELGEKKNETQKPESASEVELAAEKNEAQKPDQTEVEPAAEKSETQKPESASEVGLGADINEAQKPGPTAELECAAGKRLLEKSGPELEVGSAEKRRDSKEVPPAEREPEVVPTEKSEEIYGVFFRCPILGNEVRPKHEWKRIIKEHISELRNSDEILASILAIKSLNSPSEADRCIALIIRYLRNLIEFPENDKYKCIRMTNAKFIENVLNTEGGVDFLIAAGFVKELFEGENPEYRLIFKPEPTTDLEGLVQSLVEINGFELILDRDFKMFSFEDVAANDNNVPDDFFELTVADIKKEQRLRTIQLEKESMLMTRKMREMEKLKNPKKKALYTRIRIRLPNELIIQGTFSVQEKFKSLRTFIDEKLEISSDYSFMVPAHIFQIEDEEKTFAELDLQPAVQLILKTSSENIIVKTDVN